MVCRKLACQSRKDSLARKDEFLRLVLIAAQKQLEEEKITFVIDPGRLRKAGRLPVRSGSCVSLGLTALRRRDASPWREVQTWCLASCVAVPVSLPWLVQHVLPPSPLPSPSHLVLTLVPLDVPLPSLGASL